MWSANTARAVHLIWAASGWIAGYFFYRVRHLEIGKIWVGLTPLINAAKNGSTDAVRFILTRGADPNYMGDSVTSPAYWAAMNCHSEGFKLIVAAGGKLKLPGLARQTLGQRLKDCRNAEFAALVQSLLAQEDHERGR